MKRRPMKFNILALALGIWDQRVGSSNLSAPTKNFEGLHSR